MAREGTLIGCCALVENAKARLDTGGLIPTEAGWNRFTVEHCVVSQSS